jgi:hypothetical protein
MPADRNTMIVATVGVIMILTSQPKAENPAGTITVGELLESPIYGTDVRVYGKVSDIGKDGCSCFYLESGKEKIRVRYENGDIIDGLKNGASITVLGSLTGWGGSPGDLSAAGIKR